MGGGSTTDNKLRISTESVVKVFCCLEQVGSCHRDIFLIAILKAFFVSTSSRPQFELGIQFESNSVLMANIQSFAYITSLEQIVLIFMLKYDYPLHLPRDHNWEKWSEDNVCESEPHCSKQKSNHSATKYLLPCVI